ncbi:hypothetical protein Bbelb_205280 [Branchiostoma belcheri]|nr:hypothetical protein Bbelb_205280 [Branchiostoma belcheri]
MRQAVDDNQHLLGITQNAPGTSEENKMAAPMDISLQDGFFRIEKNIFLESWQLSHGSIYPEMCKITNTGSSSFTKRRVKKDPRKSTVFLFPGQGAQFVGMARSLLGYPNVEDIFVRARDILGYDILQLCVNGPLEELNKTVHCQPAVFLTSLAAVEKLRHENPTRSQSTAGCGQFLLGALNSLVGWIVFRGESCLASRVFLTSLAAVERLREENPAAVETCVAAAGFSVGEYAALVFSGALSFEEALYVVKERAEAMQRASEEVPSGMLSVLGRPQTRFPQLCHDARIYCKEIHNMEDPVCSIANYLYPQARVIGGNKEPPYNMEEPVCSIANYLYPQSRVIGGNKECLSYIRKHGKKYGLARMKPVPVSGAFHTALMESAQDATYKALQEVDIEVPVINVHSNEVDIEVPVINVHSNVDTSSYQNPHQMRRLLTEQVASPVKWEQLMHTLYERAQGQAFPDTYEVGPGGQLGAVLARVNMKARKEYQKVSCGEEDDSSSNAQATPATAND